MCTSHATLCSTMEAITIYKALRSIIYDEMFLENPGITLHTMCQVLLWLDQASMALKYA